MIYHIFAIIFYRKKEFSYKEYQLILKAFDSKCILIVHLTTFSIKKEALNRFNNSLLTVLVTTSDVLVTWSIKNYTQDSHLIQLGRSYISR